MKSVLISIQPKWCELIASGKKRIEVRKTRPQIDTPFKCYIYMTATKERCRFWEYITAYQNENGKILDGSQKVIGEFVCDRIETYDYFIEKSLDELIDGEYRHYLTCNELERTCLSAKELEEYLGEKDGYGWHISDLKIYDTPKELGEFKRECKQYGAENPLCDDCIYFECCRGIDYDESDCVVDGLIPLTRPPQSWCYVEELL